MLNRTALIDYLRRKKEFHGIERELRIQPMEGKITSIIGPRRAGKTFYMLYLLNRKYPEALYLNFELLFLKRISAHEFFEIIKIHNEILGFTPKVLLLDEIQEIRGWETLLRTLLDYGFRIFVTGSSSKLLSREMATQLRGRSITYLLLPFSFREFLKAKGFHIEAHPTFEEMGKILKYLKEYLHYGGFPEVVLARESFQKEKLLKTYFDEIFLKDFMERHRIRSWELGRFLFEFMFQNYSKEISLKKIEAFLTTKVPFSKKTIYKYLDALKDTLSIFFVDKFSSSVYVRKEWPKKVYIVDPGLTIPISFSEDIGKKMETIVFLELLRKTNTNPFMEVYYWKDYDGREVDLVVKERSQIKELIQVTYASSREEIKNREIESLIKASKTLKCKRMCCITWDYEGEEKVRGGRIKFIPLWRWLLA